MAARSWKCQRVTGGQKCGHTNPSRKQLCSQCGKARPPRRKPAHMAALELTYEQYVDLNGSETCGICGRPPSAHRKLDRDHAHTPDGLGARGLLCARCNRSLPGWMDTRWLMAACSYLTRHAERTTT